MLVTDGSFAPSQQLEEISTATLGVDAYSMFDFFGSWSATERLRLRFGIDNLLDEDPEIVNQTAGQDDAKGSTLANYYDTLGGFDVGVLTASSTSFGASSSRSRGDSISSG